MAIDRKKVIPNSVRGDVYRIKEPFFRKIRQGLRPMTSHPPTRAAIRSLRSIAFPAKRPIPVEEVQNGVTTHLDVRQ